MTAARLLVGKMIDELSARGQTQYVRVNRLESGMTGFESGPGYPARPLPHTAAQGRNARRCGGSRRMLLRSFRASSFGMELNTVCIDPGLGQRRRVSAWHL